jgi:hypothetical protein
MPVTESLYIIWMEHDPTAGKYNELAPSFSGRLYDSYVGFEVLRAVVMEHNIFWDIKLCSSLSVNRRFGGIYRLYLQGRKIKLSKKPA